MLCPDKGLLFPISHRISAKGGPPELSGLHPEHIVPTRAPKTRGFGGGPIGSGMDEGKRLSAHRFRKLNLGWKQGSYESDEQSLRGGLSKK